MFAALALDLFAFTWEDSSAAVFNLKEGLICNFVADLLV